MFQITGNQIGGKLSAEQVQQFNDYAIQLQQFNNQTYTTGKEFLIALLSRVIDLEQQLLSRDNVDPVIEEHELSPVLLRLSDQDSEIASDIITLLNLNGTIPQTEFLEAIKTELSTPKEEPQKLMANQLIVTLTNPWERKIEILQTIADNRAKKFGTAPDTLPELAEKMIFNDNVVFNLGGEFYTGL